MYIRVCAQLRVPYYIIYVRRGLSVAVWIKKAIPEPRLAEQQDCSPAFIFAYSLRVLRS